MILERIEQWFASKCDGDWEHQGGVSIETSDNPGWCVRVTFDDVPHRSGAGIEGRSVARSETDFVTFLYDDPQKTLRIACGALNLSEALGVFLEVEGELPTRQATSPTSPEPAPTTPPDTARARPRA